MEEETKTIITDERKKQIIKKFSEINNRDGELLIEHIIQNNYYDDFLINKILYSLSRNNKRLDNVYDYIFKHTNIDYYSPIDIDYYSPINESGSTILHYCAMHTNMNLLKYLISRDVDMNYNNYVRHTPFIMASYKFNIEFLDYMLKNIKDIDINAVDNSDRTILMEMSSDLNIVPGTEYEFKFLNTIKFLMENGADPNFKNKKGETSLHIAMHETDNINIVRTLLDYGANIDEQDNDGNTPIMLTNDIGDYLEDIYIYEEKIKLLLEYGANIHIKNIYGSSGLNIISSKRYSYLIKRHLIKKKILSYL